MRLYDKEAVLGINNGKDKYYMPNPLFDSLEYKLVRLELKWAYVACLNALLDSPSYDNVGNAYIKDDNPQTIEYLKTFANKKVDQEKIDGYLKEMEEQELIVREGRNIFIKRIESVF